MDYLIGFFFVIFFLSLLDSCPTTTKLCSTNSSTIQSTTTSELKIYKTNRFSRCFVLGYLIRLKSFLFKLLTCVCYFAQLLYFFLFFFQLQYQPQYQQQNIQYSRPQAPTKQTLAVPRKQQLPQQYQQSNRDQEELEEENEVSKL